MIGSGSTPSAPARQRGIGIIEVLVALVVVSLGVLGMAGLQLTGMKHSAGSLNRSLALLLAENMASRMRINDAGRAPYVYDDFDSDAAGHSCASRPAPYCQATVGEQAKACGRAELARFDLFTVSCGDWGDGIPDAGVKGHLPGGRLQIDCDTDPCTDDSTWTIAVTWEEGRATSDDEADIDARRVSMRLRP